MQSITPKHLSLSLEPIVKVITQQTALCKQLLSSSLPPPSHLPITSLALSHLPITSLALSPPSFHLKAAWPGGRGRKGSLGPLWKEQEAYT